MACRPHHGYTGAGNHKLVAERTSFTKMTEEIIPIHYTSIWYNIDVIVSFGGGGVFGSNRCSKYALNSACWACLSFYEAIDMKMSVASVKRF